MILYRFSFLKKLLLLPLFITFTLSSAIRNNEELEEMLELAENYHMNAMIENACELYEEIGEYAEQKENIYAQDIAFSWLANYFYNKYNAERWEKGAQTNLNKAISYYIKTLHCTYLDSRASNLYQLAFITHYYINDSQKSLEFCNQALQQVIDRIDCYHAWPIDMDDGYITLDNCQRTRPQATEL